MAGILADNIDAAAHKITDMQGLAAALVNAWLDPVSKGQGGQLFDDIFSLGKITPENPQQSDRPGQTGNSGIFPQRDGPSRHYLVELNAPCYNLQFAQRIAFTSFGRTLRNTDFIAVTDGPGTVERCFMKTFYTLEKIEK